MDNIVVANKATSELTAKAWGNLSLDTPSVVQMPVPPSQVSSVSRNGQDLVVNLKNGEQIKVANFFNTAPEGPNNDMVFQGEDGTLWQAQYDTQSFNGFTFDEVNSLDELIADAGVVGGSTPTFAIAGLGLLGAGGAAAAAGGVAGGGGGGGGGNAADTSAPVAPGNLLVSADGTLLTGTSEAGATIQVRNTAGTLLGSGVVAPDGTFSVTLNPPQTSGQPLAVSATDAAGNVSPSTQAPTPDTDGGTPPGPDTTPPAAPANLAVNPTGDRLTGSGEVGATIQVRAADGSLLGTGIVAADGTFSLTLSPPQTDGQSLTVSAVDAAGNVSPCSSAGARHRRHPTGRHHRAQRTGQPCGERRRYARHRFGRNRSDHSSSRRRRHLAGQRHRRGRRHFQPHAKPGANRWSVADCERGRRRRQCLPLLKRWRQTSTSPHRSTPPRPMRRATLW
ncbi:BapA prefix-like domain-containing protein [Pseudomonas sp. 15A4]|nr:BapA prefix-like domain-containing protein [Pseudomonas sp. 15A4]